MKRCQKQAECPLRPGIAVFHSSYPSYEWKRPCIMTTATPSSSPRSNLEKTDEQLIIMEKWGTCRHVQRRWTEGSLGSRSRGRCRRPWRGRRGRLCRGLVLKYKHVGKLLPAGPTETRPTDDPNLWPVFGARRDIVGALRDHLVRDAAE